MKKLTFIFALLFNLNYICKAQEITTISIRVYNETDSTHMLITKESGTTIRDEYVPNRYEILLCETGEYYKAVFTNGKKTMVIEFMPRDLIEHKTYFYRIQLDWSSPNTKIKL